MEKREEAIPQGGREGGGGIAQYTSLQLINVYHSLFTRSDSGSEEQAGLVAVLTVLNRLSDSPS